MIETAFGWIGEIASFVGRMLPRLLIVKWSHRAVKYVRGSNVVALEPGLHIYWPLVTEIETCAVVLQVLNLPTQLLETADGAPVAASGVVEYTVDDPIQYLAECENAYEAITNVATAAIRRVVNSLPYAQLQAGGSDLDRKLTGATQRLLGDFGVHVKKTRLSDFARVRPIHITGGQEFNFG